MNQLVTLSNDKEIQFILGPCQIESYNHALFLTSEIKKICDKLNVKFIFKASFDKANRTSINGKRGLGMEEGLTALYACKHAHGVPILTDIHEPSQAERVAEVVDVIQIPALLSRQTDLLVAAGKTGKIVNVKKGQFMSPFDMKHVVDKIAPQLAANFRAEEKTAVLTPALLKDSGEHRALQFYARVHDLLESDFICLGGRFCQKNCHQDVRREFANALSIGKQNF